MLQIALKILLILFIAEVKAQITTPCLENATTQHQLHICANQSAAEADQKLNETYQKIRIHFKEQPLFLDKLKLAQRAWIKLRNADLAARFPRNNEPGYYGSAYPMCYNEAYATITNKRTRYLQQWLAKSVEGDLCRGSLP